MPRYRLTLSPLPQGATAYVVDFQEKGVNLGSANWSPLFDRLADKVAEFEVVHVDDLLFRVRMLDVNGLFVQGSPRTFLMAADKPAQVPVVASEVSVSQAGPAVAVEPVQVGGHDVEIRTGPPGSERYDALPAPVGAGCCEGLIPLLPDEVEQIVFSRLVRQSDGRRGPWTETPVPVHDPGDWGAIEDHAADFSGGTISEQGGKPTMEEFSGGLRPKRLPVAYSTGNDAIAYATDNSRHAYAPHPYPVPCIYEAPEVVMGAPIDFRLQAFPATQVTRSPMLAYSPVNKFPRRRPAAAERLLDDPEGDRRLMALRARNRMAYATEEDHDPPRVTQEVSTTQDGSTWSEWKPMPHGRDIESKGIRSRLVVLPPLGPSSLIVIPSWTIRRRRKNRKWEFRIPFDVANGLKTYTFSPAPRVMFQDSLSVEAFVVDVTPLVDNRVLCVARATLVDATQVRLSVAQIVAQQVTTSGGTAALSFVRAFGATPRILVSPVDAGATVFAGHHTPGTTGATVYATDGDGAPADVPVDTVAYGPPPADTVVLHVVLAGF